MALTSVYRRFKDMQNGIRRRTALKGLGATLGLAFVPVASATQRGNDKNSGNGDKETGMYKATYAYDANGNWYGYNLSNLGEESGTVGSIDELEQETLTTCYYKVQYQGDFGDDPYLDMGWIRNNIVCTGYEPDNQNVLYVSQEDHRYTGEGTPIWNTWEYFVDAQRGDGNVLITDRVRPANGN
jgi:hypothetical protein